MSPRKIDNEEKVLVGKQTKKQFVWRCKYNNEDNQKQATGPHFIENEMKTNKFNSILVSELSKSSWQYSRRRLGQSNIIGQTR